MLIQVHPSSGFSLSYHHHLKRVASAGKSSLLMEKLESPASLKYRSHGRTYCTKSPHDSFYLTNKITSRGDASYRDGKQVREYNIPKSRGFQDILLKKLDALYRFSRIYSLIGTVVGITSVCFLPIQTFADLTPQFFMGLLKALVPIIFVYAYQNTLNQVYDVEIDKINKPYLPLASGELSMGFGIASVFVSLLMCLATGIMFRSPPLLWALSIIFLIATAYSHRCKYPTPTNLCSLPYLRWKRNSFLTAMSLVVMRGIVFQFAYFIHIQKYVLGRPIVITRQLIFTSAFMSCLVVVIGLIKDIPDVAGDKKFGLQNSIVRFGKERVFWLCVYSLLIAYGGAVVVGASSSSLLGKFVTIIGHSTIALFLWLRARTLDLSDDVATQSFYMFIWKLYLAEYLLIHFLR